jgi:ABC-2 type transport system permease protein
VSRSSGASTWALLGNELRLTWRARTKAAKGRVWQMVALAVVLAALGFGLGLPFALALNAAPIKPTPIIVLGIDAGLVMLWTLMLSQTVSQAAMSFYERGDLDLLLSSPTPPQRILTVRCASMVVTASALFIVLVTPIVVPAVVMGHFKWVTVYPVLIGLALLATAVGLMIAMALFRLLGPRATKTLAQIMGALIGAAFFLAAQARNFLPDNQFMSLWTRANSVAAMGYFSGDQPAAWPARAVMGEPIPALVFLGASLLLFLVVVRTLGRRFATDAAAAAGIAPRRVKAATGKVRGFDGGAFSATLRKEMRLLARDPALLSQVLLRILYVLPIAFVLWRTAGHNQEFAIARTAGALVFMTSQLAGSLAWIMVSAEDALELLACAPVGAPLLRRAKLTGAMIPVALLLIVPLAGLTFMSPWTGLVTVVGCAAAALSACLIAIWYEKPGRRTEFRRRRGGTLIGAIAELSTAVCWSAATGLAASHLAVWAAIPAVIGVILLIILRRPERSFAETLAAAQP